MERSPLFLAQIATEILETPDPFSCCQRLSAALEKLFPEARIALLLSDGRLNQAAIYLEDGEPSHDSAVIQSALERMKALSAPDAFQAETDHVQPALETLLAIGGQTIGYVAIRPEKPKILTDPEAIAAARFLALQAAAAIELKRLLRVEQDRLADETALIEAGRRLSEDLQPETLPQRILEELATVVPYERGSLLLQEGDHLRIAAQRGFPEDERVSRLAMTLRQGDVYDQIVTTAQPLLVDDVTQTPGWTQVEWLPLNLSWLGIPIFAQNRVAGMVSLTRRERAAFSPGDVLVATAFAIQASVALENAALYTEIRRFNQQLEQIVQERTEALRQALATLERMDRNKSNFISITAHELRTPLTVMKGYLGILEGEQDLLEKPLIRQALTGLLKGTERMHEIVESMLELARLDNELLEVEPGLVVFSALAKRIASDFEGYLKERKQTLELANLEGLPVLIGDPDLLLRALRNVVINAIKYTPDGGTIKLAGRTLQDEALGPCVELTVQDTGIGIDPENHELIFEKFYSLGDVGLHSSGKYTFKGGGPGLGLALARGIVQAHKGRIWVESEGCNEQTCPGSTFHILLPMGDSAQINQ